MCVCVCACWCVQIDMNYPRVVESVTLFAPSSLPKGVLAPVTYTAADRLIVRLSNTAATAGAAPGWVA